MNQEKLEALLTLLVPQIVAEIVKAEGAPEAKATEQFFGSRSTPNLKSRTQSCGISALNAFIICTVRNAKPER